MKAWYYDESNTQDPRELHQFSPNRPVSLQELKDMGVLYETFDVKADNFIEKVDALCQEKNYKNRDQVYFVF